MKVADLRFEIRQFFDGCPSTIPAKRTPQAWYVPIEGLPLASQISKKISEHFDVPYNVLKLSKSEDRATLLWYPSLGKCFHPKLKQSKLLWVHFTGGNSVDMLKVTQYGKNGTAPILHSLHMMLDETHPSWKGYADQDMKERKLKMFRNYTRIGQSRFWDDLVRVTPGTDPSFLSA